MAAELGVELTSLVETAEVGLGISVWLELESSAVVELAASVVGTGAELGTSVWTALESWLVLVIAKGSSTETMVV